MPLTRNTKTSQLIAAAVTTAALFLPATAQAYVGPGAGLTAIGTVIALLAALVLAIVGFVWYPAKRFLTKRRASQADQTQQDAVK